MSKTAVIIGGGPNLSKIDRKLLYKLGDLFSINKSAIDFPDAKYFVTIDNSIFDKMKNEINYVRNSTATKFFIANFANGLLEYRNGSIVDKRFGKPYNINYFDCVIRSNKCDGIGYNWNDFRNGNCSGYCAMQLAILMGYKNILLAGIDLMVDGNKTHYHNGYNTRPNIMINNLNKYYEYFRSVLPIDGINISTITQSRLNDIIPYVKI